MRLEDIESSRSLLSCLAEFGYTVILRKMLETGEYKEYRSKNSTFGILNPLYYASSEDVVDLLVKFAQDKPSGVGRRTMSRAKLRQVSRDSQTASCVRTFQTSLGQGASISVVRALRIICVEGNRTDDKDIPRRW